MLSWDVSNGVRLCSSLNFYRFSLHQMYTSCLSGRVSVDHLSISLHHMYISRLSDAGIIIGYCKVFFFILNVMLLFITVLLLFLEIVHANSVCLEGRGCGGLVGGSGKTQKEQVCVCVCVCVSACLHECVCVCVCECLLA